MGIMGPSAQNPLGLHHGRLERVRVKLRGGTAVAIGEIVHFAHAGNNLDAAVTDSVNTGGATDPSSNVVLAGTGQDGVTTPSLLTHFVGVALDVIADNGEGWVCIRGKVQAIVTGTPIIGVMLTPGASARLVTCIDGSENVAYCLEAQDTTNTLSFVMFNGIEKFGIIANVVA